MGGRGQVQRKRTVEVHGELYVRGRGYYRYKVFRDVTLRATTTNMAAMSYSGGHSPDSARNAYQNSFMAKVQCFMVNNSQAFNELTKVANPDPSSKQHPPPMSSESFFNLPFPIDISPVTGYYGDPLPLEYAMGVPADVSRLRLLQVSW